MAPADWGVVDVGDCCGMCRALMLARDGLAEVSLIERCELWLRAVDVSPGMLCLKNVNLALLRDFVCILSLHMPC